MDKQTTQSVSGSNMRHALDKYWSCSMIAPGNPTLWRGVPVAPIQKSFGSSERDWKPRKKYRFLVNFAPTDSLDIPLLATVRLASIRPWRICRIPTFLPPRWWIPSGLLWFAHVNWIGICEMDRKVISKIVFRPNFFEIGLFGLVRW